MKKIILTKMIEKKKIEEWARQQANYMEEILFLRDILKDSEDEIYYWRNEYSNMLTMANKWKYKFLKLKGIELQVH